MNLRCFKCEQELGPVMPGQNHNQPNNAVIFQTPGQYGSSVFDPMDGSLLEINICDRCLTAGNANVLHMAGSPKRKWKQWSPPPGSPNF